MSKFKKNFNKLCLNNISWDENLNINSKYPLLIYSNEFFDCFPVRQFVLNKFWYEKYIGYNIHENNLFYKNKLVKNKKLLSLLVNFQKQKIYECSFERNKYFENICKLIKKRGGIFLTIDYGYFTEPKNYTLQAVQNHKFSNVLENIGNQDISSHVNFGDFIKIVKKYDLKIEEFCTQREFLIKFGIVEREKNLTKLSNSEKISKGVDRLIDKNKMGNLFKFLVVSNLK